MWSLNQFPRENNRVASLTHTHHFTRSLWNCKIIQIQVVNVSLCISISQVPKYTSYSRRIVPYSHRGTSSTGMNHKIFEQTTEGYKHCRHEAIFKAPLYLLLGHMCFSCYRTYVMILCNWLTLWQNAFYLYLGRLRMCLTTSRNHVSRSSVESFKSVQEIKQKCKFIKPRKLVDTYSTPPICRGLRISYFNSDFLGIRESVYVPSFLLTLDI